MSEPIRAVDRALDILLCFTRETPRLTMSQIADKVGMNKSTVHRLLGTLEKRRFLQRDPVTGLYQLGIRLLQMAYLTLEHTSLREIAAPHMRRLGEQYLETVTLSIPDETEVIFIEVIESPQRVKLAATPGQKLPAFCTAAGKAILARLTEGEVLRILEKGMKPFTSKTIQSQDAFLEDLEKTRRNGFSFSLQEYEEGINAVAAPILDQDQVPIAAISVAGPAYRLGLERMLAIGPSVREAAQAIALEMNMKNKPG